MNQPNDDHSKNIEERVADLEQLFGSIIKNEEALIRLSERHRFNLQGIGARVGNIELDTADSRERFDHIEQTLERHDKRFDRIERTQNEIKATQSEHGDMLRMILARLPQPGGE